MTTSIYACPLTYVRSVVDWHCHWLKEVFSSVVGRFLSLIDLGGKSSSGDVTYAFVLDSILGWKFSSHCSSRSEFSSERWSAFGSTIERNAATSNDFPVEIARRWQVDARRSTRCSRASSNEVELKERNQKALRSSIHRVVPLADGGGAAVKSERNSESESEGQTNRIEF